MKLLLHTCCGPCAISCIESLVETDMKPTLFFFNPNIHPYLEFEKRIVSLQKVASIQDCSLIVRGAYGLRDFLAATSNPDDDRCYSCYRMRLEQTARFAYENEYSHISTTLLISPYQKHDAIIAAGTDMAQKYGVSFLYRDFRPYFRAGQQKARELELYMQSYCGCIYSEGERYEKRAEKFLRGLA